MSTWHPIETAPSGVDVLVWSMEGEYIEIAAYRSTHEWCNDEGFSLSDLTHWMPLPPPPETTS